MWISLDLVVDLEPLETVVLTRTQLRDTGHAVDRIRIDFIGVSFPRKRQHLKHSDKPSKINIHFYRMPFRYSFYGILC